MKKKRDLLFARNKPEIREAHEDDLKWLWAAYKSADGDLSQEDFIHHMESHFASYNDVLIVEDYNSSFKNGIGPIAVVAAKTNNWIYEPHVEWFPWATNRNKLRSAVGFFQKYRYKQYGVVIVHCLEEHRKFFDRMKNYVPLFFRGKIPSGDEFARGDDYIFSMRAKNG